MRGKNQQTTQKDVLISPDIEQYPCYVGVQLIMDGKVLPRYQRILEKKGNRTKFAGSNPMQEQVVAWEEAMKAGDESDKNLIYPLVLYLSSARLWNENNKAEFNYDIPNRTDAYHRCLDPKRGMQMPFNYIRYLKEVALQEKQGVDFSAYTLILGAINKSMEEELKPGERIEYSVRYKGLAESPSQLAEEDCKCVNKYFSKDTVHLCQSFAIYSSVITKWTAYFYGR